MNSTTCSVSRTGQRFLEVDVGIAFFSYGKRSTNLDGGRAPVFQGCFDFLKFAIAAGEYQRDFFAFQTQVFDTSNVSSITQF